MRVIYAKGEYRIIEVADPHADLDDLKGDIYNPEVNSDIDPEQIRKEELDFEDLVAREGVYGYVLERWNSETEEVDEIDSCYGFVGQYTPGDETFDHYIVDELKAQIPSSIYVTVDYFWRAPKPSCNWCPRLTRITVMGDALASPETLWINGHNDSLTAIKAKVKELYSAGKTVVTDQGQVEIAIKEFNIIARHVDAAPSASELKRKGA